MHELSESLHSLFQNSTDWEEALLARMESLKKQSGVPGCAEDAFELGRAFEHCARDRKSAITAYVLCYGADPQRLDSLARARQIVQELGDFVTNARLARLLYRKTGNPNWLVVEGVAWLDAGHVDRAIKPLLSAKTQLPDSPEIETALRSAKQEWPDVRVEIERLKTEAQNAPTEAAAAEALVQAVRVLRMLKTSWEIIEQYLLAAFTRDPENLSALGMLEHRLDDLRDHNAFMKGCERRIVSRKDPVEHVDELRRLGARLSAHEKYRGLGVRLTYRALDLAYRNRLQTIPGHVAMIALFREYCQEAQLFSKFLALVELGLELPLPEVDLLYLALQGLEVATQYTNDRQCTKTYAELVCRFAPSHPMAIMARAQGLAAPTSGGLGGYDPTAPILEVEDTVFLDMIDRAEPPIETARPPNVREQLAAAQLRNEQAQKNTLELEPVDLEDRPAPSSDVTPSREPELVTMDCLPTDTLERIEVPATPEKEALTLAEPAHVSLVPAPAELLAPEALGLSVMDEATPVPDTEAPRRPSTKTAPSPLAAPPKVAPKKDKPRKPVREVGSSLVDEGWDLGIDATQPGATAPPTKKKALGRISLIPKSAIAALKTSAVKRATPREGAIFRATRVQIPVSVEFTVAGKEHRAVARDLSETGAFLVTAQLLSQGTLLDMVILLPISRDSLREERMTLKAKVVRCVDEGYGVVFVDPSQEFRTGLKKLIEQA